MIRQLALFAALLAASCATTRVSTADERAVALTTLTTVESAVLAAAIAGKIPPEHVLLAQAQIADLRAAVAASETQPVSWVDLYQRVLNYALQWGVTTQ